MGTNVLSNAKNVHCPAIQYGCHAKPLFLISHYLLQSYFLLVEIIINPLGQNTSIPQFTSSFFIMKDTNPLLNIGFVIKIYISDIIGILLLKWFSEI